MYEKIVEWLYLNDRKFGSARQWREEFLKYLKSVLEPNTKTDFKITEWLSGKKVKGHFISDSENDTDWGHTVLVKKVGDKFVIFNPWGKHKASK